MAAMMSRHMPRTIMGSPDL
jgi:hypothetical protein